MQVPGGSHHRSVLPSHLCPSPFYPSCIPTTEILGTGLAVPDRGRNTTVIFADAAGAAVVRGQDEPEAVPMTPWRPVQQRDEAR